MIKKMTLCMLVAAAALIFTSAFAGNLTNSAPGETIRYTPVITGYTGTLSDFVFSPSPAIETTGDVDDTCFAVAAAHNGALGKTDGKEYGMACDTNQVWWADVSTTASLFAIGGTNSSNLAAAGLAY